MVPIQERTQKNGKLFPGIRFLLIHQFSRKMQMKHEITAVRLPQPAADAAQTAGLGRHRCLALSAPTASWSLYLADFERHNLLPDTCPVGLADGRCRLATTLGGGTRALASLGACIEWLKSLETISPSGFRGIWRGKMQPWI